MNVSGTPQKNWLYKESDLTDPVEYLPGLLIINMSNSTIQGKVSFVNHDKEYIIIEYEQNGKKKTVNGNVDEKTQLKWKAEKRIRRKHLFHIGDTVSFRVELSGRGDRMTATDIQYLYNTGLDMLINKAKTENNFTGYLKIVDDNYFVKEIGTYIFIPVPFSPWQIKPTEQELNEAVTFSLENTENKEKVTAALYNKKFIPAYYKALQSAKNKIPIEAEVFKVTPHGIYLHIYGDRIQAKLPVAGELSLTVKPGDKISVIITYLGPSRIVVEQVKP